MKKTLVKKSSGDLVPFDASKLEVSLFRSGASPELIKKISLAVSQILEEGLSTKAIYKKAYQLLRASSYKLAGRYKLNKALLELGPSGYPFEEFVSHLFAFQGFDCTTGVTMNGKCITHEVDVWARREEEQYLTECKHHATQGYKSDVKVVLYIHSRFNDIVSQLRKKYTNGTRYQCWIVTNTRFTTDAIDYANCYGLRLMSWDYPSKGSLKERVDLSGLYPITCLCTLTKSEKEKLLKQKIVLCQELIDNPEPLRIITPNKVTKVLRECASLVS